MTDKQKASAVLSYLEEFDSKVVINLINPYLKDEDLAQLYDKLSEDGREEVDEDVALT